MSNKLPRGKVVASALITSVFILVVARDEELPPAIAKVPASFTLAAKPQVARMKSLWSADSMAASMGNDSRPPFILLRQKKMQALMTGSPLRYYTMKLRELRTLASHGDADAMMQLAEQYCNEDGRIRADPDYPVGENTRDVAKQYLSDAFVLGRIRAAALLSRQLFDENQLVEAYSWRLVSERFGDSINPLWGSDTNQFVSLSDDEKTAAIVKADAVSNLLLQNKMREFAKTHQPVR